MRAVPKTYFAALGDGSPQIALMKNPRDGMFVLCEITDPPSMKGRNIDLFLDEEMVTKMLITLRDEASRARRTSAYPR